MRIAHLNGAPYEAAQHAPIALSEGLTEAQIAALAEWRRSDLFDETQTAVLAYCDAMTREIRVPDEIYARVRRVLDDRCLVELTATIGAYNMVSRFLEALKIDHHDDIKASAHGRS
jgi:alkylhydroperoxidase family enzyme